MPIVGPVTAPPAPAPTRAPAPGTGSAPGARGPRLRTLDGLRFAAAAAVLLYHFAARDSTAWEGAREAGEGTPFPSLGGAAVYLSLAPELFFVISGFVVLWTAWGRSVPAVVASRVARLYPAYWAALALTGTLLLVVWPEGKEVSLGQVLVNATLLQAAVGVDHVDGVYWTLWAELRFYLLVVLLVALGLTRRRVLAFVALWPLAALAAEHSGVEALVTLTVAPYAPFFAGGMALFLLWRDGHAPVPWLLVAGNAALGVHTVALGKVATLDRTTTFTASPVVLALVALACFALVALATLTPLRRWDAPALTSLGTLTYPLYLVHLFWGWWVIDVLAGRVPPPVALAAAAAVALGLAWLVHHGVEKRLNPPLRRGVERGLTDAAAATTAVLRRARRRTRGPGAPRTGDGRPPTTAPVPAPAGSRAATPPAP